VNVDAVAAVVIVEAIAVTDVVKVAAIAINYLRNNPNKWRKFKNLRHFILIPSNCTTRIASLIPFQSIRQHT
jgi:hypothetical protein